MSTRNIGNIAEEKAITYLKKKHYKIITKNFFTQYGEIDIICISNKNILVFIEVKSSKSSFIDPIYKLNKIKIKKIIDTSNLFISMYNYNSYQVQYDYIGIINNEINHYKNIITNE